MGSSRQTTCWRSNEVSLARDSFNCIVARKRLDVTDVMIKHINMGRRAEMSPRSSHRCTQVKELRKPAERSEPSEMRPTAKHSLSDERPPECPVPPLATPRVATPRVATPRPSTPLRRREVPKVFNAWSTPKTQEKVAERAQAPEAEVTTKEKLPMASGPVESPGGIPQSARERRANWEQSSASRPQSAAMPNLGSTTCWRPGEHSLLRNSFNSIVGKTKLDVTEVMIRHASMGRQAEMGPQWSPGGLASRRMASVLTGRA